MALTFLSALILVSEALAQSRPANTPTPTFFLARSTSCEFDTASLDAGQNFRETGSLCAYLSETRQVYACPAPDPICWNGGESCKAGGGIDAGANQTLCNVIGGTGDSWCCNSFSGVCTENENQSDNCWSWFLNPNRYIEGWQASLSASRAFASATSTNVVVSTYSDGGWIVVQSTSTTSSTTTDSASTSPAGNASSSRALSGAAIAGIVIGSIVIGVILATGGFFIWRRRRETPKDRLLPPDDGKVSGLEVDPSSGSHEEQRLIKQKFDQHVHASELNNNIYQAPVELDSGQSAAHH